MIVPKPVAVFCPEFTKWIRGQPCFVSGEAAESHHVRGRRFGDVSNVVPLSHSEHMQLHSWGKLTWQKRRGVNLSLQAALWWARWQDRADGVDGVTEMR